MLCLQIDFKSKCQQYSSLISKTDLPLRFAVISDWGPIIVKPYKPLNDTLDYLLAKRKQ